MAAPLLVGAVVLAVAAAAAAAVERARSHRGAGAAEGGVLPAYPRIVAATPAQRRAILDAAANIPVAPAALATVIQSESGWDSTLPHDATGTPRAGLNQITLGAHMPGLDTADKVWAVRSWPMEKQLAEIVVTYFKRVLRGRKAETALDLYKVNFLPALAGEPHDFHLGEKGSQEVIPGGLTKGQIYDANPGFDPGQKKGFFTWDDVAARIAQVEKAAHGQVVDVSGKIQGATSKRVLARQARVEMPVPRALWAAPHVDLRAVMPAPIASPPPPSPEPLPAPPPASAVLTAPTATTATSILEAPPAPVATPTVLAAPNALPAPASAEPSPAPAVLALRDTINRAWPKRGTWSDGLMGDAPAQARKSDHGLGNALDITFDDQNGPDMDALAEALFKDRRVTRVIWNNRVRSRDVAAGEWRPYCDGKTSCNPHTRHLHVSIDNALRDDLSPWEVGSDSPAPARPGIVFAVPAPSSFEDHAKVGHYLRDAWFTGRVDNVDWIPIQIGPFALEVAAEPLAVNGMRIPTSMNDAMEIARALGAILPTQEIADAIWAHATRKLSPTPLQAGTDGETWKNVRAWNALLGDVGKDLAAGGWRHWLLASPMGVAGAVNYGLRKPDGTPWEKPNRKRGPDSLDETQLFQPVRARAHAGEEEIDLLEWLSRSHDASEIAGSTGKELGGPINPSLLARFRGG